MCVHVHTCAYVCKCVHVCLCVHVYVFVCMCVCECVCEEKVQRASPTLRKVLGSPGLYHPPSLPRRQSIVTTQLGWNFLYKT